MELVVVLAIVGLLAAIASLATVRAKETARMTTCVGNLRQIAAALVMYHAEQGQIALPQQPALPLLLANYVTDDSVFVCPSSPFPTSDSYSRYYLPRNPAVAGGFLLGCSNHEQENTTVRGETGGYVLGTTLSAFTLGRVVKGRTAPVTWNQQPVTAGATVQGGTLHFADGTNVTIDPNVQVVLLASFDEGQSNIYSGAIRISNESAGTIRVEAASGTHFDIATPACTAGVRGTKFTVTTAKSSTQYTTTVAVTEGLVAVSQFWPSAAETTVAAGQSKTYAIPTGNAPEFSDFVVRGPTFDPKEVVYQLTNSGSKSLAISRIDFTWPSSDGKITVIALNNVTISSPNSSPTSLSATSFSGGRQSRTIKPGQTLRLDLRTQKPVDVNPMHYTVRVAGQTVD